MHPVRSLFVAAAGCFLLCLCALGEGQPPLLYPEGADARGDIARAVEKASQENKHVLIQWGANWCVWCHRLHAFFSENTDAKELISKGYVVVLVDTDTNKALLDEMDVPVRGIPFITVLDGNGKKLVDQDSGLLEASSEDYDPEKVNGFLRQWRPAWGASSSDRGNADERIAAALEIAKGDGRAVLVTVGASWCNWCGKLEEFLKSEKAGAVLNRFFVMVPLDQDKVKGTNAFRWSHALDRSTGIPWYAALDSKGQVVATSDAKEDGNTGYPARPEEIAWFMEVVKRAAPGMDDASREVVESELKRLSAALPQQ